MLRETVQAAMLVAAASACAAPPAPTAVGGRWSVRDGAEPACLFRDGDADIDLFSYHMRDSNDDGIDEVRLAHEDGFLVMESQGWPNHPTATFPNSGNPNVIRVQAFTFRLPLEPRKGDGIARPPWARSVSRPTGWCSSTRSSRGA